MYRESFKASIIWVRMCLTNKTWLLSKKSCHQVDDKHLSTPAYSVLPTRHESSFSCVCWSEGITYIWASGGLNTNLLSLTSCKYCFKLIIFQRKWSRDYSCRTCWLIMITAQNEMKLICSASTGYDNVFFKVYFGELAKCRMFLKHFRCSQPLHMFINNMVVHILVCC